MLHQIAIKVTKCVLIIACILVAFLIAMAKYLMKGRLSFDSQFDDEVHHVEEDMVLGTEAAGTLSPQSGSRER